MAGRAAKPETKREIGSPTDQMRAFAWEYTIDFHGKNAAIRAGYSEKTARVMASKLLAREDIQAIIRERMEKIEKKTEISSERVIRETWGVATADVNELVEFRRGCCRHCYGIDYGYQRTVQEMSRDRAQYELDKRRAMKKPDFDPDLYEPFDEKGGIGYDARKAPNPDCQECFGEGVGMAYFKDTRTLSPEARALYAGVKQTKDGYQMLLVDKNAALEKLFKHFGLYKLDNKQKTDNITEFLQAVMAGNGKLPIKPQS